MIIALRHNMILPIAGPDDLVGISIVDGNGEVVEMHRKEGRRGINDHCE